MPLAPTAEKDAPRKRWIVVLSWLGLLGLISPIVGVVLAAPAQAMALRSLTAECESRKRLIVFSGIVPLVCVVNAGAGNLLGR
jgi:hypothetical protein